MREEAVKPGCTQKDIPSTVTGEKKSFSDHLAVDLYRYLEADLICDLESERDTERLQQQL